LKDKSLPNARFRYIESELYQFDQTKKRLKELKAEIACENLTQSYNNSGVMSGNSVSSKTEAAGIKLLSSAALCRMARNINAISRALQFLNEDQLDLFHLKYKKQMPWQQILKELGIAQATYYRWRKKIVYLVARELGMLE